MKVTFNNRKHAGARKNRLSAARPPDSKPAIIFALTASYGPSRRSASSCSRTPLLQRLVPLRAQSPGITPAPHTQFRLRGFRFSRAFAYQRRKKSTTGAKYPLIHSAIEIRKSLKNSLFQSNSNLFKD